MTQSEFNQLPWLLTRKMFRQLTNLSDADLAHAVRSGEITPFYARGKQRAKALGYAKYRKTDAARIAGLKV